jgi:hypothetical protein
MYRRSGKHAPNRAAPGACGWWANSIARRDRRRPLFVAASADPAEAANPAASGNTLAPQVASTKAATIVEQTSLDLLAEDAHDR